MMTVEAVQQLRRSLANGPDKWMCCEAVLSDELDHMNGSLAPTLHDGAEEDGRTMVGSW